MTEETLQTQKDAALGQYVRIKQLREDTKNEIQKLAARMRQLSTDISYRTPDQILGLGLNSIPWINPEPIHALAREVESAEIAFDAARQRLIKLKIPIPF